MRNGQSRPASLIAHRQRLTGSTASALHVNFDAATSCLLLKQKQFSPCRVGCHCFALQTSPLPKILFATIWAIRELHTREEPVI